MKNNKPSGLNNLLNQTQMRARATVPNQVIDSYTNRINKPVVELDINELYAAPNTWNKFPSIKETSVEKYIETKLSIANSGVFNPLIVWEYSEAEFTGDTTLNGKYMILAGHNRWNILKELCEEYPESASKYMTVLCKVYRKDEIDEIKAREIINDTNILQRDKIPNGLLIEIINDRLEYASSQKTPRGESIQQLTEKLGLEKSAIYEAMKIKSSLIEPLKTMYFEEKIKKKGAVALAGLSEDIQQWIVDSFTKEEISSAQTKNIKKTMTKADLRALFRPEEGKGIIMKDIRISIPVQYEKEIKQLIENWKKEHGI